MTVWADEETIAAVAASTLGMAYVLACPMCGLHALVPIAEAAPFVSAFDVQTCGGEAAMQIAAIRAAAWSETQAQTESELHVGEHTRELSAELTDLAAGST